MAQPYFNKVIRITHSAGESHNIAAHNEQEIQTFLDTLNSQNKELTHFCVLFDPLLAQSQSSLTQCFFFIYRDKV